MRAICMATRILIPTPLRPYTDKQDAVDATGATVGELLADLTRRHSGLKAHLFNDQGKLRSFLAAAAGGFGPRGALFPAAAGFGRFGIVFSAVVVSTTRQGHIPPAPPN